MAFTDNTTGGRIIRQGIMPYKLALTDTCYTGDLIGYEGITDNTWQRADADGKVLAQLIAGEPCKTSGDTIVCYKMAVIENFSAATAGDMVYLANTAGQYAATVGSWVMQCVGQALSATEAFINPSCSPVSAFASTGTSWAGYFRSELESGRTASDLSGGVRIDAKTIATSVPADIYGLYIFGQLQNAPSASSAMIRLEDGCSASCGFDTWMSFVGGPDSDPPDYLFEFTVLEPTNGAWSDATAANATPTGRLKINMGGLVRYIPITSS